MVDVVSPEVRSRMMSGIRGKHTKPELMVRRALHAMGFRYRLHPKELPGRPDLLLSRYRVAIFVHGCFWHGHDCPLFKWPQTRPDFWQTKINRNHTNDVSQQLALAASGWRIAIVWECALRGSRQEVDAVTDRLAEWIKGAEPLIEIRG